MTEVSRFGVRLLGGLASSAGAFVPALEELESPLDDELPSRRRRSRSPPPESLTGAVLAAPPRAAAVVGRVEPRALEVHRDRVEHALDGARAAHLAHLDRRVAHALEHLEHMPLGALVLVDRH